MQYSYVYMYKYLCMQYVELQYYYKTHCQECCFERERERGGGGRREGEGERMHVSYLEVISGLSGGGVA